MPRGRDSDLSSCDRHFPRTTGALLGKPVPSPGHRRPSGDASLIPTTHGVQARSADRLKPPASRNRRPPETAGLPEPPASRNRRPPGTAGLPEPPASRNRRPPGTAGLPEPPAAWERGLPARGHTHGKAVLGTISPPSKCGRWPRRCHGEDVSPAQTARGLEARACMELPITLCFMDVTLDIKQRGSAQIGRASVPEVPCATARWPANVGTPKGREKPGSAGILPAGTWGRARRRGTGWNESARPRASLRTPIRPGGGCVHATSPVRRTRRFGLVELPPRSGRF